MSNHALRDLCHRIVGVGYDRAVALASGDAEPETSREEAVVVALREGWTTAGTNAEASARVEHAAAAPSQDPFAGLTADDQGRLG